jgi:[ribosomal protein S5]-alanine N-acetyltransferase
MILVQSKQYETARLVLKVLDESYADKVLDYHIRNSDFLAQWEPIRGESFYRIDYHRNQLQNDTVSIESGNALRLWVFKKDEPDKIIGVIAFNNIERSLLILSSWV